ncbi:thioredoxin-disulfide reductase [candidate division WWE3 bacterium RIFOXYC1_FULL_39_7]|uniref:Thioredoxin reductase n=2 Tax=Katanobacteria TaxID=422282 RepID=A0A1F4XBC9_UNCKA|nr:MAG: thioredoxin-disulfide reductase [candidate division WWE3 bacterium RIFOXYC1_FULL_39_7]OGC78373.1 MAG: thioredoxin-disulfide reductase [candidate division WWE3 bacterium RIFOXYD1_FULL_39_9]
MSELFDVIIIGGGPAGLTAAIYASRGYLKTLVIAGNPAGGQLTLTTDVDNYPGFPEGILGPELIEKFRKQAEKYEATFLDDNVVKVAEISGGFEVETDSGKKFQGKSLLVASGASAKWLNIESEQRLRGKGVSACATCDGFFFRNKNVVVVGGGDSAMEEATYLTKFANKVTILVRGSKEEMRASKIMQQRAFDDPKIEFLFNSQVQEVLGTESVTGLKILNNKTNEVTTLDDVQGLFVAIGHKPNTDYLKDLVELNELGYVKVTDNTKTSKKGIFVGGDVSDFRYRQAITAAGYGCMAAIDAGKYLAGHDH